MCQVKLIQEYGLGISQSTVQHRWLGIQSEAISKQPIIYAEYWKNTTCIHSNSFKNVDIHSQSTVHNRWTQKPNKNQINTPQITEIIVIEKAQISENSHAIKLYQIKDYKKI